MVDFSKLLIFLRWHESLRLVSSISHKLLYVNNPFILQNLWIRLKASLLLILDENLMTLSDSLILCWSPFNSWTKCDSLWCSEQVDSILRSDVAARDAIICSSDHPVPSSFSIHTHTHMYTRYIPPTNRYLARCHGSGFSVCEKISQFLCVRFSLSHWVEWVMKWFCHWLPMTTFTTTELMSSQMPRIGE